MRAEMRAEMPANGRLVRCVAFGTDGMPDYMRKP